VGGPRAPTPPHDARSGRIGHALRVEIGALSGGTAAIATAALASVVVALAAAPAPNAPLPRDPAALRGAYLRTTAALDAALDRWDARRPIPREIGLDALYQERIVRLLATDPPLAAKAGVAEDDVVARRDILRLSGPFRPGTRIRVGAPPRPAALRRWYAEAEHRFGVPWSVLAAVNFVESRFGAVRNDSTAGAQGPMQFLPSTWREYGLGGDVHDPHDAILGAANLLHANSAHGGMRGALYHYNASPLYVDAVMRYAHRLATDRHAFLSYYAWPVYVRTSTGLHRVTGPR
jgi:membrane-bound lytic murein transglycosylase B